MNNAEIIIACNEAMIEINKGKIALLAAEAKINAIKQAIIDSDEQLKAVCKRPEQESLMDKLMKLMQQRSKERLNIENGTMQTFAAELYLFPQKADHFDAKRDTQLARKGAKIGIEYTDLEPIVHVFFRTTGDTRDNCSWQDHELPVKLVAALGLDVDDPHFAPSWIPLYLVQALVEYGEFYLHPTDNVQIHITAMEDQGMHEDLRDMVKTISEDINN
jgi:hypothetical protein